MNVRAVVLSLAIAVAWAPAARGSDQGSSDGALRQSLEALTREVQRLRVQLAAQAGDDMRRFNANVARLNLVQGNLERLKKEREAQQQKLRAAQARQDDARYKLANIQQMLSLSTEVDRTNAENRLRDQFTRQIADAIVDADDATTRIAYLDGRIERTERIVETLDRRLKIDDSQIDVDDSPPPPAEAAEAVQ